MKRANFLFDAIASNRKLFGCWLELPSPAVAEIMGLVGYDLVVIDLEHGPAALHDATDMMRALAPSGTGAMVRVPANDRAFIKRVLDQGPDGIMVPMVQTAGDARDAVAACHYPPRGKRGWAAGVARAALYGLDETYTTETANRMVLACQIESVEAVDNIDEICAVEGVDLIFVGRNDLAADAGHILDPDHPEVERLVHRVVEVALQAGRKLGTVPSAGRQWLALYEAGFDIVVGPGDISLLRDAGRAEIRAFRERFGSRPSLAPKRDAWERGSPTLIPDDPIGVLVPTTSDSDTAKE